MDLAQKITLSITCVLGLIVLLSYIPIAKEQLAGKYDYWVGFSQNIQYMLYPLMGLAAIGFVTFIIQYLLNNNNFTSGLFSYHKFIVPILVGILLLASICWSICVMYYVRQPSIILKTLTSICLIVVAICSVLLLAGYTESQNPKWYVILGLIAFCVVTVLNDGVIWNSKMLTQKLI